MGIRADRINLLSAHNCELLRNKVLAKPDGMLRVVILDPSNQQAVQLAVRQLDDSLDYPIQDFRDSLATTERQLRAMYTWKVRGQYCLVKPQREYGCSEA